MASVGGRWGGRASQRTTRRQPPRGPSGRGQQSSQQAAIIIGGAIGAAILIVGFGLLLGGRTKRPRPRAPAVSSGRLTREEAWRLKTLGIQEFRAGESLYRQAGEFGSPGYSARIEEARKHLSDAARNFERAQEVLREDEDLQTIATQCNIILNICSSKVPVDFR